LWCHVSDSTVWYFWFVPLILSMVISLTLYILTLYRYRQIKSGQIAISMKASHLLIQKRISFFVLTFCFCWLWDIVQHLIPYDEDRPILAIAIVHAMFVPLQGFLNCLLYGFSSNLINFRTLFCMQKRPRPLYYNDRTPLVVNDQKNDDFVPRHAFQGYNNGFGGYSRQDELPSL